MKNLRKRQIFAVSAVTVLVAAIFSFMSGVLLNSRGAEAARTLRMMETRIASDLFEPEATVNLLSRTVRRMILRGDSKEAVLDYMAEISGSVLNDGRRLLEFNGVYGAFDAYGGAFLDGDYWDPGEGYDPASRPWYTAAVEAGDRVAVTRPYTDVNTGAAVATFCRRIFGGAGEPLGVVALDVSIKSIGEYVAEMGIADGGYGVLLNSDFEFMTHPDPSAVGTSFLELEGAEAAAAARMGEGQDARPAGHRVRGYGGHDCVLFVRDIANGWKLGIFVPLLYYYSQVIYLAYILAGFGVIVGVLACVSLFVADQRFRSERESRRKSGFLAAMSHEIRTPMNAIIGITEMQLRDGSVSEKTADALNRIYSSGYLLLGIINDILDLSKIQSGRLKFIPSEYDTASLINDTVCLNIMSLESREIEFRLTVDENLPSGLLGDELRIKQILNNLLSNAFKYTDHGEIKLDVWYEPEKGLCFTVSDTGKGMTKKQLGSMFDEDTQSNLGMSITRQLVQMMSGEIKAESEVGKGTVFTVSIPQTRTDGRVLGKDVAQSLRDFKFRSLAEIRNVQVIREPMPYGRVLIVDDVETNLYVAKGLLAPYELKIETALSGAEAIGMIQSGSVYDIVFMDHMMPEMDGIDAVKLLRGMGYMRPVVALTANAVVGQAEIFMSNGFDGFISKPIDIRELNAALNRFIRDRQPREVIQAARQQARGKEIAAMSASGPDPQLAKTFARDAEKALATLAGIMEKKDGLEEGDMQLYTVSVHAMKSALALVGEQGLSASARRLEREGRARNTEVITSETPAFLASLHAIVEKLRPEDEDAVETCEDREFLAEKLGIVTQACAAYDKRAAKDALAELNLRKWPRETHALLDAVAECLLHSDFDEAVEAVEGFWGETVQAT